MVKALVLLWRCSDEAGCAGVRRGNSDLHFSPVCHQITQKASEGNLASRMTGWIRQVLCVFTCVVVHRRSVLCGHVSVGQSAGTFEDVEKPTPSYKKTRPVEAGEL